MHFCMSAHYAFLMVCRSHSMSTDYGGDNFDGGHSEGFSLSSDYDVSFIGISFLFLFKNSTSIVR